MSGFRSRPLFYWLLSIGVLFWLGCHPAGDLSLEPAATEAPAIPLPTLEGEILDLTDYRGQVVLLNFWATWCAPCRIEMPELDAYFREHRDDGFVLLAINAGEPVERVAPFIAEHDFSFTVVLDEDRHLGDHFGGLRAMPTSHLLDRDGEVVQTFLGIVEPALLDAVVTPLLQVE